MAQKPERLGKGAFLDHWRALPTEDTRGAAKMMRSVAYKHRGSTFDQDGIRLTGSRAFIDAMLSTLKPLLERENLNERLQVNYTEATDRESGLPMGSWTCYIQVHERGREAKMVNAFASDLVGREVIASRGY